MQNGAKIYASFYRYGTLRSDCPGFSVGKASMEMLRQPHEMAGFRKDGPENHWLLNRRRYGVPSLLFGGAGDDGNVCKEDAHRRGEGMRRRGEAFFPVPILILILIPIPYTLQIISKINTYRTGLHPTDRLPVNRFPSRSKWPNKWWC